MFCLVALQITVHVMERALDFYVKLFLRVRAVLEAASAEARNLVYLWGLKTTDIDRLFK
ncbi:hypothetical protein PS652_02915 [Pseudomonas fluorescens]|uniref:Uncharacterized protein n=1 Tax=Pseudomonas fluorescens TaxID=294 RepID=A0A5E6X410_PSEFL|nr:hypothetical protein PS652_05124 [Pseudomonas fluorescens]